MGERWAAFQFGPPPPAKQGDFKEDNMSINVDTTALWDYTADQLMTMRAKLLDEEISSLTPAQHEIRIKLITDMRIIAKKKGYRTPGEHF